MRRFGWLALITIMLAVAVVFAVMHKSNSANLPTSTSSNSVSSSNQPSTGTINIRNGMFTPSQITVAKGGTVTWTNNDTTAHTVEDDLNNVGGPASGDIQPNATYSFTFNKTGSFQYHDRLHSSMRGTIVVK